MTVRFPFRLRLLATTALLRFSAVAGAASSPASEVRVALDPAHLGPQIPADFVGLSFEISNLLPDEHGRRIFTAENKPLVALFRGIGIKNLRVGGGTAEPKSANPADNAKYPVPGTADIDALFGFAEAADVNIIYTFRLLRGDKAQVAALARHIATHYPRRLQAFQIGNEPDWHAYHTYPGHALDPDIVETVPGTPGSAYPSYLAKWRDFAAAIIREVPDAKFGGPDTGSNFPVAGSKDTDFNGHSWTEQFAADVRSSGHLVAAYHHDYTGQDAKGVSIDKAVNDMLSTTWPTTNYPALFDHVLAPVQRLGIPYRMTEANDHTGGVDGASNAFVSALWALDYLHWHAARGAIGINFHNKRWIYTCTIIQDANGVFRMNPKGYGFKAFNLGSRGRVESVTVTNSANVNVTAYAAAENGEHCVTLINKEHGADAHPVQVTIALPAATAHAEVMLLTAPKNNPLARDGISLGGAPINEDGSWKGQWTPCATAGGSAKVTLSPTSAAIVRIAK